MQLRHRSQARSRLGKKQFLLAPKGRFFLVLYLLLHIVTNTTFLRGFQRSPVIISESHPLFLVFFFRPPRFLCPTQTLAQFMRWFSYWRNSSNFPRRRCPFACTLHMPFEHFFLFFFSVPSTHLPCLVLPQRGVLCLAGAGQLASWLPPRGAVLCSPGPSSCTARRPSGSSSS